MDDLREKVIRGLEMHASGLCNVLTTNGKEYCPYWENNDNCMVQLLKDALSLLKAKEPDAPYMDYDGQDVWRCGSCGATLFHLSHTQADENEQNCVKFCRYCGKAVKWDE